MVCVCVSVCLAVCVSEYLCVIGKLGLKNSPVFCFLELHAFHVDPFPCFCFLFFLFLFFVFFVVVLL